MLSPAKIGVIVVLMLFVLTALLYLSKQRCITESTASAYKLEVQKLNKLNRKISELTDENSFLETAVKSLRELVSELEEKEISLQERLLVALYGNQEARNSSVVDNQCDIKLSTLSTQLADAKELLNIWNVTLRECQTKLRTFSP